MAEFRNPEHPWPDNPEIPELRPVDFDPEGEDEDEEELEINPFERHGPPDDEEIDEQNALMLRQQRLCRLAAQCIANVLSKLPEVQSVEAFGAVAGPLDYEVPRFSQFRRYRIEILHECADLDLAVRLTSFDRLNDLRKTISRALGLVQESQYGGVAHHQVDAHLFDAASKRYRGRLCHFGSCPKEGKRECLAPRCGEKPFLQQFERYWFNPEQFKASPRVLLFERSSGYLVALPSIKEILGKDIAL